MVVPVVLVPGRFLTVWLLTINALLIINNGFQNYRVGFFVHGKTKTIITSFRSPARKLKICTSKSCLFVYDFNFEASVNRLTAMCSSKEETHIVSIARQKNSRNGRRRLVSAIIQNAEKNFALYPWWLCRFPTTLGVCRLVSVPDRRLLSPALNICKSTSVNIYLKLFRINLLTLGPTQVHARRCQSFPKLKRSDKVGEFRVVMPIEGGFLTYRPVCSRSMRKNTGALIFHLTVRHCSYVDLDITRYTLRTALSDYRPFLCGSSLPVSNLRAFAYLRTQGLIHAWVMNRFHRYCRLQLLQKLKEQESTTSVAADKRRR